jgi:hypothetical protein
LPDSCFAGCGLSSGFNNPLFWDLLLVNSIPIAHNYQVRPYADLLDQLTRARAQAEVNLVAKLKADPDWRASAFVLERGFREHWGKGDQTERASVVIQIPESLAGVLADALRVGAAHAIEVPAQRASAQKLEQEEKHRADSDG